MFLSSNFDDSGFSRMDLARDPELRHTTRQAAERTLLDRPDDTGALMMMGHVLVAEEDFDNARMYYLKAHLSNRTFIPAILNCGAEYVRAQEFDTAEDFYRLAETRRPQCPKIASYIGICRLNQDDPQMAEQMFTKAVRLKETYAPPHLYLAVLADRRRDYDAADQHALNAVIYAFEARDFQIYTDAVAVHHRVTQKINGHSEPETRY